MSGWNGIERRAQPRGGKGKYGRSRNPAGRPKGSGKYGEPTVTFRIPVSKVEAVRDFINNGGRELPLYVMAKTKRKSV